MRRVPVLLLLVLAVAAAAVVGVVAYGAGVDAGTADAVARVATSDGASVVHVVGVGHRGWWPGGFLLFPFAILFWVLLLRALVWGRRGPWHHHRHHDGLPDHVEARARAWHEREHGAHPDAPVPPGPGA